MENIQQATYIILAFGTLAAAFKAIDWLISLKYMTKDKCCVCRAEVAEKQSKEDVKLTRIETKVDMLLERWRNET